MLVVKDIEVLCVERNRIQIARYSPSVTFLAESAMTGELKEISIEDIHGQTFSNSRGERICIGMSNAAQQAIGLPFEAFERMNHQIADLHKENLLLRHMLDNKNSVKQLKQHNLSERLLRCITEI